MNIAFLKKYNQRLYIATIAFCMGFVWLYPVVIIHEGGHSIVCQDFGGKAIFVKLDRTNCIGLSDEGQVTVMRFAGGALAGMFSMFPLAVWNKYQSNATYRGIAIAFLTFAWLSLIQAVLEAANFDFYSSDLGSAVTTYLSLGGGMIFFFLLTRSKNIRGSWTNKHYQTTQ